MSEIWTAVEKRENDGQEMIVFDVENEETGAKRKEKRYTAALPLMFVLGGYPPQIGAV